MMKSTRTRAAIFHGLFGYSPSFAPVTRCDPCTGCSTTCLRPATTLVRQVRLIPYTTYGMINTAPLNVAPLGTCLGGACGEQEDEHGEVTSAHGSAPIESPRG